ncbi:hypothetical protein [Dapis sp. BLCC M229]|uniref:hypothetical protein n=1 Tax=Dapis sp. BLCC M229 TaxID=3400188 RepID=UPI003CEBC557
MTQTSVEKNTAIKRISETIDQVMERENIYQELDKNKLIQSFSTLLDQVSPQMVISLDDERLIKKVRGVMSILLDQVSPQMVISLDDERLIKKVRGVMSIELLSTIFDNFTPEQIKTFNAVVEGK